MLIYQSFLYLKQLRKDYFLEEYAFINSNSDFNSYSIINNNTEKKCLLCKSNSNTNELITSSSEISINIENYTDSTAGDVSFDQCSFGWRVFELVANGHTQPFTNQFRAVTLSSVMGNTSHWYATNRFSSFFARKC